MSLLWQLCEQSSQNNSTIVNKVKTNVINDDILILLRLDSQCTCYDWECASTTLCLSI